MRGRMYQVQIYFENSWVAKVCAPTQRMANQDAEFKYPEREGYVHIENGCYHLGIY